MSNSQTYICSVFGSTGAKTPRSSDVATDHIVPSMNTLKEAEPGFNGVTRQLTNSDGPWHSDAQSRGQAGVIFELAKNEDSLIL